MVALDDLRNMLRPCTTGKCDARLHTACVSLAPKLRPLASASHASNPRCSVQELIGVWQQMCPVVSRLRQHYSGTQFIVAINDVLFLMCKYNRLAGDIFYGLHGGLQYIGHTPGSARAPPKGEINCVAVCVWSLITNAMAGNTAWSMSHQLEASTHPVVAAESEDHIFIVILESPKVLQRLREGRVFVDQPEKSVRAVYEATIGWLFDVDTWNKTFSENSLEAYGMHWILDVEALQYTHFTSCNTVCVQNGQRGCLMKALQGTIHNSIDPLFRLQHVFHAISKKYSDSAIALALEHVVESIIEGMQNTYARVCYAVAKDLHAVYTRSRVGVQARTKLAALCTTGIQRYPTAKNRKSHRYLNMALELCLK